MDLIKNKNVKAIIILFIVVILLVSVVGLLNTRELSTLSSKYGHNLYVISPVGTIDAGQNTFISVLFHIEVEVDISTILETGYLTIRDVDTDVKIVGFSNPTIFNDIEVMESGTIGSGEAGKYYPNAYFKFYETYLIDVGNYEMSIDFYYSWADGSSDSIHVTKTFSVTTAELRQSEEKASGFELLLTVPIMILMVSIIRKKKFTKIT